MERTYRTQRIQYADGGMQDGAGDCITDGGSMPGGCIEDGGSSPGSCIDDGGSLPGSCIDDCGTGQPGSC
jgi:hypothetical protein